MDLEFNLEAGAGSMETRDRAMYGLIEQRNSAAEMEIGYGGLNNSHLCDGICWWLTKSMLMKSWGDGEVVMAMAGYLSNRTPIIATRLVAF